MGADPFRGAAAGGCSCSWSEVAWRWCVVTSVSVPESAAITIDVAPIITDTFDRHRLVTTVVMADSDVEEVPDEEKYELRAPLLTPSSAHLSRRGAPWLLCCRITVVYVNKDGSEKVVRGNPGQNLLRLAQQNHVDLEGACECSLACSTCHVVVDEEFFDELPEATEDEDDLLDLAFGLTPTSRLGCQVKLCRELDGIRVTLPAATRNFYVDGHVPQPH